VLKVSLDGSGSQGTRVFKDEDAGEDLASRKLGPESTRLDPASRRARQGKEAENSNQRQGESPNQQKESLKVKERESVPAPPYRLDPEKTRVPLILP